MDVGVARTNHDTVVTVKQPIAVEPVGPGFHCKKEPEQYRAVSDHRWRHRPALDIVLDVAMYPIDRPREERTQEKREKHPILDRYVGRQRKEIEADILVVEWIGCAVRHLMEKSQEDRPIVDFSPGNKHGEQTRTDWSYDAPWKPMARKFQRVRQSGGAGGFPLEIGGIP